MDYSEEQIALFDRFINDEMSPEDKSLFQQRLLAETLLKEQFEKYQALKGGIELHAIDDLMTKMNQWDENISPPVIENERPDNSERPYGGSTKKKLGLFGTVEERSKKVFPWKRSLSIAASILLASILFWQLGMPAANKKAYPAGFEHYPSNIHLKRSVNDDIPLRKQKAYNLYEIKEYKLAAPLLEAHYQESKEIDALFYAAVSYMASGQLPKARQIFQSQKWSGPQSKYIEDTLPLFE